ncbi:MAG: MFS transporter [Candidatus Gastranaerophilales bacterium]|nr:MFS transporter [Candidatus Gastranaerophilales bacterium]
MTDEMNEVKLKRFSTIQLLNFCLGFFGLQFAWQMRIILSGPVTEGLGADPFIFGLIWLAGPVTGMVVQPIIGAMSDNTHTKFGKRRPYIFLGALFASIALVLFPNAAGITEHLQNFLPFQLPAVTALCFAAIMIWVIDACVNAAQGPYRALIPDNMPVEQHSLANSYLSFAIGLGSVIAAGTAPFLKWAFDYQMSIPAQFVMAAVAFFGATLWTCMTINEIKREKAVAGIEDKTEKPAEKQMTFGESVKAFFASSPEIAKICTVQFFTWIGIMCMFIYFTQYAIHTVFAVPDLTSVAEEVKISYEATIADATNFSSVCFAIFNLVCFIVSLPIGILSSKFGNKTIHAVSLVSMAIAFGAMAFTADVKLVMAFMALAGIGWASTLALPFAMLTRFISKGSEGSVMGIFNIFIAGPQIVVCTLLAWFINQCSFQTDAGINYHYEYSLIVGAVVLFIAAIATMTVQEGKIETQE